MTLQRTRNADPLAVWGAPSKAFLSRLGRNGRRSLRRYVTSVTAKCYRFAYDCGVESALPAGGVVEEIAKERRRQVAKERWSHKHDDAHFNGELAVAAAAYALDGRHALMQHPDKRTASITITGRDLWCWDRKYWKPRGYRENLIRAAALIVAEIERLDRAARR